MYISILFNIKDTSGCTLEIITMKGEFTVMLTPIFPPTFILKPLKPTWKL